MANVETRPGPHEDVEDRSPRTGWTRSDWARLADGMLAAARRYASPGHARITFPGVEGGYGRAVDGLEGFARTFLLAGFRLAGEGGADPHGIAEWYARGIATGTDPQAADRWVRLDEHPQAKVEAASIALVLDLTRPWIWDRLDEPVRARVVDYLSPVVGDQTYPRNNWLWFRLVVQTFLSSAGGPFSPQDMADDLALHDSFTRPDGWSADGDDRAFDHYVGWALHLYPTLWARMSGAQQLAAPRADRDTAALDRYLRDAIALVGADGSPLVQGRSLIYRFAAAAPFWVGAMAEVPSLAPGLLRRAASGIVSHFVTHGAPDDRGVLTMGWHGPWRALAQSYSGPSSPYWASKGMLGLALPADHPVWTAVEEPLPVERGDVLRAVRAPGWLVAGTRADGIVRIVNHGTDHAQEGSAGGDSPLYARIGYSTATSPLLDEASWQQPSDQGVHLLAMDGRVSHRSGMRLLETRVDGEVGVGASRSAAHWLDPDPDQPRHGSGLPGRAVPAGILTLVSLVRGAHEVRAVRVEEARPGCTLRVTGWPLSGADVRREPDARAAVVLDDRLLSRVRPLVGAAEPVVLHRTDASPLGTPSLVPGLLLGPAVPGRWTAAHLTLTGRADATGAGDCTATIHDAGPVTTVDVTWPDGLVTSTRLSLTPPGETGPALGGSGPVVGP
ncbi:MAG TPA: DUF2264 domain-containing protein [Cellulomonas sp.]